MRIIKCESSSYTTNVERALRKLKYIQKEISEAIKYLESDAECKDAICAMAAELYRANDIATALAADAQSGHSDVKTESLEDGDKQDEDEGERFKKAWDSIGFHGGGRTYSAEEFLDKIKKASELKW